MFGSQQRFLQGQRGVTRSKSPSAIATNEGTSLLSGRLTAVIGRKPTPADLEAGMAVNSAATAVANTSHELTKRRKAYIDFLTALDRTIRSYCSLSPFQAALIGLLTQPDKYNANINNINIASVWYCFAVLGLDILVTKYELDKAEGKNVDSRIATLLSILNELSNATTIGSDTFYFVFPMAESTWAAIDAFRRNDQYGRVEVSNLTGGLTMGFSAAPALLHMALVLTKSKWEKQAVDDSVATARFKKLCGWTFHGVNALAMAATLYFIESTILGFFCLPGYSINQNETGRVDHYNVLGLYGINTALATALTVLLNYKLKDTDWGRYLQPKQKSIRSWLERTLGIASCFAYISGMFFDVKGIVCELPLTPAFNGTLPPRTTSHLKLTHTHTHTHHTDTHHNTTHHNVTPGVTPSPTPRPAPMSMDLLNGMLISVFVGIAVFAAISAYTMRTKIPVRENTLAEMEAGNIEIATPALETVSTGTAVTVAPASAFFPGASLVPGSGAYAQLTNNGNIEQPGKQPISNSR